MVEFRKQAERFGTEFLEEWITNVDLSERPFTLYTDDTIIKADTLIIASGASAKWLGIPGEAKTPQGFGGNGVSACATCDGPLPAFRNKHLVVVGGGDTAMEEATFLTRYATRVFVVHRRDKLRASKIMQDKAFRNDKIEFIWNTDVAAIIGTPEQGVTGVHLRNVETGEEKVFDCEGVFIAIGHKPNTDLFKGQIEMDRGWLHNHQRPLDRHQHPRRFCLRRRAGFSLSPGSHRGRHRLHVGHRRRALSGSLADCYADRRRSHDRRRAHHAGSSVDYYAGRRGYSERTGSSVDGRRVGIFLPQYRDP